MHTFPIPSTSLHHQNCTPSTSRGTGFSPPAPPLCSYQSPQHYAQPGVSSGSGAQGAAGMLAANPREGGTKVPRCWTGDPLARWNPPQRDFVPVPGERSPGQERSGAGSGSEGTPSGFPRSSQAAKGPLPCVFNPFSSCCGESVGGHLQTTPPHCPPPRPEIL